MTPLAAGPELPAQHESLYAAVTGWAGHAARPVLAGMAAGGVAIAATLAIIALEGWWHVALIAVAVAMIGAWGLLEHRREAHPSRALTALERAAAVLGIVAAILGAIGLLFWVLGPSWKL